MDFTLMKNYLLKIWLKIAPSIGRAKLVKTNYEEKLGF